jgi:alpha-tubulin suppressor-like RCC1 family protein
MIGKNELFTWGWNFYGQLGYENGNTDQMVPTIVQDLAGKKVVWVSCGEGHTVAVIQN